MISLGFKSKNIRPIGLDIGHSCIKMIQLAVEGENISIVAVEDARIDSEINDDGKKKRDFVVAAIQKMLANGKFCGREVVSCLPNDKLYITSFRVGEVNNGELEEALRKEASQRFGLDPEKDTIEHIKAGSVRQGDEIKNELILFAAEQKSIIDHIEMLEKAGLKPVAMDVIPCALFRSLSRLLRRQQDKEETKVFVDVGSRITTVVFGRGSEISFVKKISIGGEAFNRKIAEELGVGIDEAQRLRQRLQMESAAKTGADVLVSGKDSTQQDNLDASTRQVMVDIISSLAEELAREISLCFKYYTVTFRGKPVGDVILAGGQAYENILVNVLKRHLTVEIELAKPLRGLDMESVNINRRGLLCEWAVAAGLGLKGLSPEFLGCRSDDYERN